MSWTVALNAVSSLALVAAVVFAAIEFRQGSRARAEGAAVELVRTMQDGAWEQAVLAVSAIPSPGPVALSPEQHRAAAAVGIRLETLGYQVFRGIVPLVVVDDLVGGISRVAWDRLSPWIEAQRVESANPKSYEWFQWLAERLSERSSRSLPAYQQHKEWRASKR